MIDTQYKTRKVEEEFVNKKGKTKTRTVKEPYTETSNYYYQKDHLGSIIAITDESANIVEEYVYDVFGKPYSKHADGSVTGLKKSPIGNTRLYTGREYDRGLKLYYNRARYYNPQLGRFISRDPIDIADDVNLYGYVGNNSVMYIDIFGLAAKEFVKAYDSYLDAKSQYEDANYKFERARDYIQANEYYSSKHRYQFSHYGFLTEKWGTKMGEREEIAKKLHYARNDYNVGLPRSIEEAKKRRWDTEIASYHQNNVPDGQGKNIKYVSPSGKKEIIFSANGNVVNDPEDIGTYNFFAPDKNIEGYRHLKYDVDPWKEWGNSLDDNTIY